MSAAVLSVEVILVFILTFLLIHQYGNFRTQHPIVTVAVFIASYFSFLIICIIPMDVSSTLYQNCLKSSFIPNSTTLAPEPVNVSESVFLNSSEHVQQVAEFERNHTSDLFPITDECEPPWSFVDPNVLPVLFRVLYWTVQFLTWLVLPIMQSYAMAGEFHVGGKLLFSLKRNAIYYGTYLLVFGILLIYVATRPGIHLDGKKLYTLVVCASNTWGLFLLVLLLGYGLVEIPRRFWRASNLSYQLAYTQFKLVKASTEKAEADEEVEDVLEEVRKASQVIDEKGPLRRYVEIIISKCPEDFRRKLSETPRTRGAARASASSDFIPSEKALAALHKKLINAIHHQFRTTSAWYTLLDEGFELEDTMRCRINADKTYKSTFPGTPSKAYSAVCTPTTEWWWKCVFRQWFWKAVAVILGIFSFMVVWSECTFFVREPVLSLFAKFVELAGKHKEYFNVELASFFVIAFLSICTYFTVFRLRFFNYYVLAPNHQTDENSLIFAATMLCRLTPPMCLNFLGVIHMDSHIISNHLDETAYTRIMGHLDVLPLISNGFNVYFPLLILVLCIATYFRVGSRLLNFCGFQQFMEDDQIGLDLVNEGRELMQRERRRRLRAEETKNRRDQLLELVNNTSNFGHGSSMSSAKAAILSRVRNQQGPTRSESSLRYKHFRNDPDSSSTTDIEAASRPRNPFEDDGYTENGLGISNESSSDSLPGHRQPERGYQTLTSMQYRSPPRNIFDDV